MVGASLLLIRSIQRGIPRNAKNGKKTPEKLAEIIASFPIKRPIRVMFQDEARFGRISRARYCWAKFPSRPTVKTALVHQAVYAYGAVSITDGAFDSLVLPHVNGQYMALFLTEIAERYPNENIVMILDGADRLAQRQIHVNPCEYASAASTSLFA